MHSDLSDMGEVFFALCKTIDTPVALGAWLRYKYSHIELASMDVNPSDYTSASAFKKDYVCSAFLSKYKGLSTGIDLDAVALQKFQTSEDLCRETNRRFRHPDTRLNSSLSGILHSAQRKISEVLGSLDLTAVTSKCGFGPGATFELPRRRAQADRKLFELPISVSRTAYPLFRAVLEEDLHWSSSILGTIPEGDFCLLQSVFVFQDECRIDTVPKNAKTNRIIAVEPRGNGFLQKGVGSYIRRRLRRVGIDLDDQSRNQELARLASHLRLATLDLKGASDSVSKELVYSLLPYDWAVFLDSLRSRLAEMPNGDRIVLEKFSSMGNGFTFELETLIFWALCLSTSESLERNGIVAVYGDDLVVTQLCSDQCIRVLNECGFEVNLEKSFTSGRFYESCGKHYFDGVDVTPAYQKEVVDDPLGAIRCSNRLIRLAFRSGGEKLLDRSFRPAWEASRRLAVIGDVAIPFGCEGDDGLLLTYNEFPFSKRHFGRDSHGRSFSSGMGLRCRVYKESITSIPGIESALLAIVIRRSKDRLRDSFVLDEFPLPFGGNIEFIGSKPKLLLSNRWVIPSGKFSALWQ